MLTFPEASRAIPFGPVVAVPADVREPRVAGPVRLDLRDERVVRAYRVLLKGARRADSTVGRRSGDVSASRRVHRDGEAGAVGDPAEEAGVDETGAVGLDLADEGRAGSRGLRGLKRIRRREVRRLGVPGDVGVARGIRRDGAELAVRAVVAFGGAAAQVRRVDEARSVRRDLRDERVARAAVRGLESVPRREVVRERGARDVGVAGRVDGDPHRDVDAGASEVRRVDERVARRVQLGHESVERAAAVGRLDRVLRRESSSRSSPRRHRCSRSRRGRSRGRRRRPFRRDRSSRGSCPAGSAS